MDQVDIEDNAFKCHACSSLCLLQTMQSRWTPLLRLGTQTHRYYYNTALLQLQLRFVLIPEPDRFITCTSATAIDCGLLVLVHIGRGQWRTPAEHMSSERRVFVRATLRTGLGLIRSRSVSRGWPVVVASVPEDFLVWLWAAAEVCMKGQAWGQMLTLDQKMDGDIGHLILKFYLI